MNPSLLDPGQVFRGGERAEFRFERRVQIGEERAEFRFERRERSSDRRGRARLCQDIAHDNCLSPPNIVQKFHTD